MKNVRVREELKKNDMKNWKLAELMGIGETTLCRRLRNELPEEEQNRIIALIRQHSGGGEHDND